MTRLRTGKRGQPKIVIDLGEVRRHKTVATAARALGVSRMTVMRRLREVG